MVNIFSPPSLFRSRPLYPEEVLKVPVGVNNHLLAPVMVERGGGANKGNYKGSSTSKRLSHCNILYTGYSEVHLVDR